MIAGERIWPIPFQPFGQTEDGRSATLFTLENSILRVRISDYGGRMVSIEVPDRDGRRGEVLLGFDKVQDYVDAPGAFGALLGRNANRIAGGEFMLDGQSFRVPTNDRGSTLHGGPVGFDKVFWKPVSARGGPTPGLSLSHLSPDGDQGFPGALAVQATYRLEGAFLWLELVATTTKPTVISLSAHPYFNLAGPGKGDVLGHEATVESDRFLPTDERQIPTGELRSVAGTPFDFRQPAAFGARIRQADPQIIYGLGYDQCFVLERKEMPQRVARVRDAASGRVLEVHTTQPAMQLYTGNQLDGSLAGRHEIAYRQSAGFALEPQGFPDAPHHANFPSTVLRPGEEYRAIIGYRFAQD